MKKKAIVLLAFIAALTAVSCQKEAMKEAETTPTGEGMTISAVTEGIGADVKADLAYKYDVIWRTGDKICVKNSEKSVEFTLSGGEGTTKGTFSSETSITGEVEGFYPASVANLVWPAEQQNNQVPPMYSKKNLTSTQNQTFNFTSLGSVLQLTFSTTSENVILKSIKVKADQAMSGAFTINEGGQAVISQPEGDKPGVTLDLGDTGVALGVTAKKFNIAIPAGTYTNLTITFTAKNGQKCTKHATKAQSIEYNTVNTLAVSGEFKPAGALPGVFTVSDNDGATTKQIYFSQGNLYADASGATPVSYFEANQYDFRTYPDKGSCINGTYNQNSGTPSSHYGLFTWSNTVADAVSDSSNGNNLFTNDPDDAKKPNSNFKVNVGGTDQTGWRTLSTKEWQYLFNGRNNASNLYKCGVTVCGVTKCVVIAPDGWDLSANSLQSEYSSTSTPMTWEQAETAGLVCLPAAGNREGSNVNSVGSNGYYWSSTVVVDAINRAYRVYFTSSTLFFDYSYASRDRGYSVRLITECQ